MCDITTPSRGCDITRGRVVAGCGRDGVVISHVAGLWPAVAGTGLAAGTQQPPFVATIAFARVCRATPTLSCLMSLSPAPPLQLALDRTRGHYIFVPIPSHLWAGMAVNFAPLRPTSGRA